ncbi:3'-5' exonuclease [Coniochaeta pulveracea]|uniref:RNA exonuclease 4 n=1 Tax=Coniochaeta pulveracea TaxID=177199 RepID=A0A420YG57_9PEZI|nr:3'-5' exonuclease [Coniochaeta pulveracea]
MAPELSSNWKKLQAQIKAESTTSSTAKKRKTGSETEAKEGSVKRRKVVNNTTRVKISKKEPTKKLPRDSKLFTSKPASSKPQMGAAQSLPLNAPKTSISPSLALWAEDNGISSEALAEAYGLGSKDTSMLTAAAVHPNQGLAPDIEVGKYVAVDCEMVGVGEGGNESALARVSIVDFHGRQVYDSFVRPKERVMDWRTRVSGVSPRDMKTARTFEEVQAAVAELLKGRILVGHDVRHDLAALLLEHPSKMIRDTARFSGFRKYGHGPKPALRVLAKEILDVEIQSGQHSSIEDARVAMLLFRRYKPGFDVEHANKFGTEAPL